jgi:hypothetical protein
VFYLFLEGFAARPPFFGHHAPLLQCPGWWGRVSRLRGHFVPFPLHLTS